MHSAGLLRCARKRNTVYEKTCETGAEAVVRQLLRKGMICCPYLQSTRSAWRTQVRAQRDTIDERTSKMGAEALVQQSLRKGTADNVTAVVLMVDWPEIQDSGPES